MVKDDPLERLERSPARPVGGEVMAGEIFNSLGEACTTHNGAFPQYREPGPFW